MKGVWLKARENSKTLKTTTILDERRDVGGAGSKFELEAVIRRELLSRAGTTTEL